jgi:hypothetical protein
MVIDLLYNVLTNLKIVGVPCCLGEEIMIYKQSLNAMKSAVILYQPEGSRGKMKEKLLIIFTKLMYKHYLPHTKSKCFPLVLDEEGVHPNGPQNQ